MLIYQQSKDNKKEISTSAKTELLPHSNQYSTMLKPYSTCFEEAMGNLGIKYLEKY